VNDILHDRLLLDCIQARFDAIDHRGIGVEDLGLGWNVFIAADLKAN
jgi:hypothetical protein